MRRLTKHLFILTMIAAVVMTVSACGKHKKAAKPKVKTTAEVKNGTTTAGGKGSASSDVPLRVGCGHFDKKFNPFMATAEADKQAVELTQVMLLDNDRTGRIVEQGIDGEERSYNGKKETYFGIADVKVKYKRKAAYTVYRITLRDDLLFSDGEPITIDDVIFTLYAFCDKDYKGSSLLKESSIQGLKKYQKKKADTISGIQRLNDYELRIYTDGFDQKMLEKLRIPVCALHYYGDTTKYSYDAGRFGFTRGDLSALRANKNSPLGAGPYRFVKYEKGIVYFTANELYFQECPETAYLYLEDMTQMIAGGSYNVQTLVSELTGDTVDMVLSDAGPEDLEIIMSANENGKLDGKTLENRFVSSASYGYICMNAEEVRVGADSLSEASVSLRRALATVISACRGAGSGGAEQLMSIVNTPASADSWLSRKQYGEEEIAFAKNLEGETIYRSDDDNDKKREKAKEAAVEFLQAAGYTLEEGRITLAPSGGLTEFTVWIQGGEQNPLYAILETAAEDLQELGITLQLAPVADEETMRQQLTGTQQIWCGLDQLGVDPELAVNYKRYKAGAINKGVLTGIIDERLDKKLDKVGQRVKAESRIKTVDAIYDILSEWAVEIPVYQSKRVWMMSSDRINMDTISKEITPYYSVLREVHRIKMNKE